jgi:outer membrane protein OmpA-like peptidoglycan-associated protein
MSLRFSLPSRRRLPALALAGIMAAGPLAGCTTVEKGWNSTKSAVTGLFGDDKEKAPPPPSDTDSNQAPAPTATSQPMTGGGGLFMGQGSAAGGFRSSGAPATPPPLSSVPTPSPPSPPAQAERKEAVEGLISDRARAEYTEQVGRQVPVTVRPLNEGATASGTGAPPRPDAAPTVPVTRLAEVPPTPAPAPPTASAPPQTAAMIDRLSAAPPAPPAATPPNAPSMSAAPVVVPAPQPTALAGPNRVQPLIPSNNIAGYGDDTIVVDGTGVRGGRGILNGTQMAAVPRASFDPGNASVSSEVGVVSFAKNSSVLSGSARAMLADIARLRDQVDGAIRIVGRGEQAAARAAAISRELRRIGVPADRLYAGGADNAMLGDEADIYLDY